MENGRVLLPKGLSWSYLSYNKTEQQENKGTPPNTFVLIDYSSIKAIYLGAGR
jgi:hypothetical protein